MLFGCHACPALQEDNVVCKWIWIQIQLRRSGMYLWNLLLLRHQLTQYFTPTIWIHIGKVELRKEKESKKEKERSAAQFWAWKHYPHSLNGMANHASLDGRFNAEAPEKGPFKCLKRAQIRVPVVFLMRGSFLYVSFLDFINESFFSLKHNDCGSVCMLVITGSRFGFLLEWVFQDLTSFVLLMVVSVSITARLLWWPRQSRLNNFTMVTSPISSWGFVAAVF